MKLRKYVLLFIFVVFIGFNYNYNVLAVGSTGSSAGTVKTYPQSIKINDSPKYISIGQVYKLSATITPSNVTDKTITWTSSDNSILTIDANGNITAKKQGTVKVTAKTSNNKVDNIVITVRSANSTTDVKKVKSISISNPKTEMLVGESFNLKVKISPKYVDDDSLTYSSSNTKVLKVDKNGKVTAVSKGSAIITVKSSNKKTTTMKVKVRNVIVKLNKEKVTINKGETTSLSATIKTSSNYSAKKVKWTSSSVSTSSVKAENQSNNNYTAKITAKREGNAVVEVNIDGEVAKANVKVMRVGKDYSIQCPTILYDDTGSSNIKLDVQLVGNIDHWDYYVSSNRKTGPKADWNKINTYKGNQVLYSKYSDAQGKIRVYSKEGTSRDCFTAPFNLDQTRDVRVTNYTNNNIECPKISYKYDKVNGANVYKINDVYYGVSKAYLTITPVSGKNYQYSWYANKGAIDMGAFIKYREQLYKTTDKSFQATLKTIDDYDRYGQVVVMNDKGNIKICNTSNFSNIAFSRKETIGTTNIYFEKGSNYQQDRLLNTIKNLPNYYLASPNMYFITNKTYINKTNSTTSCGMAYGASMKIYINDDKNGCNDEWIQRTVVHELSHTMDYMFSKINGNYLNEESDMVNSFNKYDNIYNYNQHKYLTDYAFTNKFEFWAELNSIDYLNVSNDFYNNYYRNKFQLDNSLKNLRSNNLKKISNIYSKNYSRWNDYKNMYK